MDKFKEQIQLQLIANIIRNKCATNDDVIFEESWCSQERVIRFTSPLFSKIFTISEKFQSRWLNGTVAMYEVHNYPNSLVIDCVLEHRGISTQEKTTLCKQLNISIDLSIPEVLLKQWTIENNTDDINSLLNAFDDFIRIDRIKFENSLLEERTTDDTILTEGTPEEIFSSKYERNSTARKKCLEYHGTVCKVCGIDFAKAYGPEFAGKIEVHHIVPISQIGSEYVVDPIKDLVPVCPNCHTALHSKKNGVYTIEELKQLRNQM